MKDLQSYLFASIETVWIEFAHFSLYMIVTCACWFWTRGAALSPISLSNIAPLWTTPPDGCQTHKFTEHLQFSSSSLSEFDWPNGIRRSKDSVCRLATGKTNKQIVNITPYSSWKREIHVPFVAVDKRWNGIQNVCSKLDTSRSVLSKCTSEQRLRTSCGAMCHAGHKHQCIQYAQWGRHNNHLACTDVLVAARTKIIG